MLLTSYSCSLLTNTIKLLVTLDLAKEKVTRN
jgi:hypothetical protein